jgi:hypothetical protein
MISAFLRKKPDDAEKAFEPQHVYVATPGSTLSPSGLLSLLDATPDKDWLISFNELRDLKLSDSVIDWLEFVVMLNSRGQPKVTSLPVSSMPCRGWTLVVFCPNKPTIKWISGHSSNGSKKSRTVITSEGQSTCRYEDRRRQRLLKGIQPQQWPVEFNDFVDA